MKAIDVSLRIFHANTGSTFPLLKDDPVNIEALSADHLLPLLPHAGSAMFAHAVDLRLPVKTTHISPTFAVVLAGMAYGLECMAFSAQGQALLKHPCEMITQVTQLRDTQSN